MKTLEVALFEYTAAGAGCGFFSTWHRVNGKDRNPDGYTRISEWVSVDFPPRDPADTDAEAKKVLQAARDRAARDLAELDAKLAGVKS